jgi:class 3 adenylate cyclase/tetratricopeptide (TPR) repeat protein
VAGRHVSQRLCSWVGSASYTSGVTCPSCGAETPAGARFCPSCGAALVLRNDERRVVTVVFGDIVGFTTLSERLDPERVKNLVDEVFDRLAADIVSFGGQVDKVIGDAIVALFGAPVAHEDDAERAVRAALKMQETVRAFVQDLDVPIRMRIGVNTGEALVGAIRADGDYTATGDAVNTASRLQSAAEPGGVLVGSLTHDATESSIRYEHVGPVLAKGKEDPVEAWRAIAPLGRPGQTRSRLHTRLIGRDLELGVLRRSLEGALQLGRSQLLLILGEAGVGKTRLAEEVAVVAKREQHALILAGRCVPYGEANVWWPVAEALRAGLGLDADLPVEEAGVRIRNELAAAFRMPHNAPEVERSTLGLLQLFDYDTPLRQSDAQIATNEAARAVRSYLQARTAVGPVVLWLADLHWADDVVLRLIDALLTRLARSPFVLLATARYSLDERWSPKLGRHGALTIGLDPLDRAASEQLLGELLPQEIAGSLRSELLDRAGGNPFFLQELVALVADGSRESIDHAELPSSVRGLVSARLDSLPDDERAALEDAAVMGRRGGLAALARMGTQLRDIPNVPDLIRNLRDRDLLLIDRDEWSFRSDLVRDLTYARLTKTERARRHAGIADYLAGLGESARVDTIAYHYRRAAELAQELGGVSGLPVDLRELAVTWLSKAASGSSGRVARDVAARLYGQALALVPASDPQRPTLLLARAKALIDARDLGGVRRDIAEARSLAVGDPGVEALATMYLAEIAQKGGDYEQAVGLFEDAAARYRRLGDTSGMAEALRNAGMTHLFSGHNDAAEADISAALQAFQDAGDTSGEAWSHQNLGWIAFVRGRLAQAERRVARAVELFAELSDEGGAAWCQGLLAYVRLHQGRFDEADELSARAYSDARERGDRWGEAMMIVVRASVRLFTGRTEAAVRRAEEAIELFGTMTEPVGHLQALALAGRGLVLSGRVEEGLELLTDADADTAGGHEGVFALVRTAAATACVAIGDAHEALRWADPDDIAWVDPALIGHGDRLGAVGLALAQVGRFDDAQRVLGIAVIDDPDGGGRNPDALAGLALVDAVTGRAGRIDELVQAALSSRRTTYVDRLRLYLAVALAASRRGDTDAAAVALAQARAEVVGTDDRVHDAVVALAAAVVLGGTDARAAAAGKLAALGVEMTGWRALFDLARATPVAVA